MDLVTSIHNGEGIQATKVFSDNEKISNETSYLDIIMDEVQPEIQGKNNIPSRYGGLYNSKCAYPSIDHSFKSEACIEHVLVFIFNGGFLSDTDKNSLLDSRQLMKHLDKMLSWSKQIDFSDIRDHINNHADQKFIYTRRIKKL